MRHDEAYRIMLKTAYILFRQDTVFEEIEPRKIVGGTEQVINGVLTLVGAEIIPPRTRELIRISVEGGYSGFYSVHTFDAQTGFLIKVDTYDYE